MLGGEALRPELARQLLAANKCRVLNHYGPTETTVGVCTFEATNASLDGKRQTERSQGERRRIVECVFAQKADEPERPPQRVVRSRQKAGRGDHHP